MSFNSMGLSEPLLKAISEKGYKSPSPIQEKVIPVVLKGKDVLAAAQTGTGKTAGFTLPILQKLSESKVGKRSLKVLVLTPTRELAAQVHESVIAYSKYLKITSEVIFGGVNANPQISSLRKGVDVLIATPGRLLDLHGQRIFSFEDIEVLVLDEADRMLDMGFQRDINKLLKLLPRKRQNLLFSATFSREIKKLASEFMHQPVFVEATPENTTVEKINQLVYRVDKQRKTDLILDLIAGGRWEQVLVFTRTKHGANRLAEKMNKADIHAAAIHGNKSQAARTKALQGFKKGEVRVLVATDIAARGLDIPLLPHVINYELPNVPEDYVHRIGRTGRAGASGMALSLVSVDELEYLRSIEKLIELNIPKQEMEGFQVTESESDLPPSPKKKNFSRGKRNRYPKKRNK